MNIETVREYCLSKANTYEMTPFDEDTVVYKVGAEAKSKIYALISMSRPDYLLLKCDPELAIDLRERYSADIEPGFHMNKRHWNGIILNGTLTDRHIFEMIDHSYQLVYGSLPLKIKQIMG